MTIEERLEELERKVTRAQFVNRMLVILSIVVVLAIWFFTSCSLTAKKIVLDEIRAKQFIVVDKNGKIRAKLCMLNDSPSLYLTDENGKKRFELNVFDIVGPSLSLCDKKEKARIFMGVGDDNSMTCLRLIDENRNDRLSLTLLNAEPSLELRDENHKTRTVLGVTQTSSKDGITTTYSESSLHLFNPDGFVVWQAP
jgi:hypothetical protein